VNIIFFLKKINQVVINKQGGEFFLYGYGGIGKIFMWKTLLSTLRSKGKIVFKVASSAITFSIIIIRGKNITF